MSNPQPERRRAQRGEANTPVSRAVVRAPIVDLATHPEPWLRIDQCAAFLGVSENQIWKWSRAGKLRVQSFSARVSRIARTEFQRFVEDQ